MHAMIQLLRSVPLRAYAIILIIALFALLHSYSHSNHDVILPNEAETRALIERYEQPAPPVILKSPDLDQVLGKSYFSFVILVERTDGYLYRKKMRDRLQPLRANVIFVQLCNTVDNFRDNSTFFAQTQSFYNPWAEIVKFLMPQIRQIIDNSDYLIFVSSNVFIDVDELPKLTDYLAEHPVDMAGLQYPDSPAAERDPRNAEFIPEFLHKPQLLNFDLHPDLTVISQYARLKSGWEEEPTFYPLGVYLSSVISCRRVHLPRSIARHNTTSHNVCDFKGVPFITGLRSATDREGAETVLQNQQSLCMDSHSIAFTLFCVVLFCGCICRTPLAIYWSRQGKKLKD